MIDLMNETLDTRSTHDIMETGAVLDGQRFRAAFFRSPELSDLH
jgi:hypothetical protein